MGSGNAKQDVHAWTRSFNRAIFLLDPDLDTAILGLAGVIAIATYRREI
ncbi:hypothetical protein [Methylocapsa aurea]|nr:hypothetical protein [Methylocapsa aurea]